jgi:uncharacterized protein (DUF1778 family)
MTQKNLYIRCSQETYDMAHALAKVESRSLNKQIIHMIHKGGFTLDNLKKEANKILDEKDFVRLFGKTKKRKTTETDGEWKDTKWGLRQLAETRQLD